MDDQEADQLRSAFEALPDDYRFARKDVDFVPAVLGRAINWSYTDQDGRLFGLTAFDQAIETAGDLRRLALEHPRTDESDASFGESLGKGIGEGLAPSFEAIRHQVTWNRVRIRSIVELLQAQLPGFYEAYDAKLREVADRDWPMLSSQVFPPSPNVTEADMERWEAADLAKDAAFVGPEKAAAMRQAWKDWFRQGADATASSEVTDSEISERE